MTTSTVSGPIYTGPSIKRHVAVLSRHGAKVKLPKDSPLTDEQVNLQDVSVPSLYNKAALSIRNHIRHEDCKPEDTVVYHTLKNRTEQTGLAIAAGSLGRTYSNRAPQNIAELRAMAEEMIRDGLIIGAPEFHLNFKQYRLDNTAFGELEKAKPGEYVRQAVQNLDATQMKKLDGTDYHVDGGLTTGREIYACVRGCLADKLRNHIGCRGEDPMDPRKLIVIVSHALPSDFLARAAYEALTGDQGASYDIQKAVGGPFNEEDHVRLVIDRKKDVYTASLQRTINGMDQLLASGDLAGLLNSNITAPRDPRAEYDFSHQHLNWVMN